MNKHANNFINDFNVISRGRNNYLEDIIQNPAFQAIDLDLRCYRR